eukprot:5847742-Amphidinium_carterae.1
MDMYNRMCKPKTLPLQGMPLCPPGRCIAYVRPKNGNAQTMHSRAARCRQVSNASVALRMSPSKDGISPAKADESPERVGTAVS